MPAKMARSASCQRNTPFTVITPGTFSWPAAMVLKSFMHGIRRSPSLTGSHRYTAGVYFADMGRFDRSILIDDALRVKKGPFTGGFGWRDRQR